MSRKIICAADFNETSRWAVSHAAQMARVRGAELVLCHFIDSPYRYAREMVYAAPGSDAQVLMGPEVQRDYEERLREFCGGRLEGRVRLVVKDGAPEVEILRLARRERPDVLFIGQGRECAPRVLARARCPVGVATGPHRFVLSGAGAEGVRQAAAA